MDARIGQIIDGRFRVARFVGRGGMGSVYEGEHIELGKRVAIKFMHREGLEPEAVARFRREARAASRVSHPNVVQIYDTGMGEASGGDAELYIVMEMLEGEDLRAIVAREGALPPARVLALATAILEGLHAIHEAGIVHRDIKPANILVLADGGVKIMDFGLAKPVDHATRLTQTGRVVGSPQFMSPEQIAGGDLDRRADIYAAGVTIYQLVVGDVPFTDLEYTKLMVRHIRDEAPALAIAKPGTPAGIASAVAKALRKEPGRRFPTALAFAAALRARAPSVDPVAKRPSARRLPPPPRSPWIFGGAIAAAGALALVLALTLSHRHNTAAPASPGVQVASFTPIAPAPVAPPAPPPVEDPPPPPPRVKPAHTPPPPPPPPPVSPMKAGWTTSINGQEVHVSDAHGVVTTKGGHWVPPGSKPVTIEISSIPIGAHVWIDDKPVGETPLRLEIAPGDHRFHYALVGYQSDDRVEFISWGDDIPTLLQARLQLLVNPSADHRLNPY